MQKTITVLTVLAALALAAGVGLARDFRPPDRAKMSDIQASRVQVASNQVLIGDASGDAAAQSISGDVTISTAGVATVVSASAAFTVGTIGKVPTLQVDTAMSLSNLVEASAASGLAFTNAPAATNADVYLEVTYSNRTYFWPLRPKNQ